MSLGILILLVSFTSAWICINPQEDNIEVQTFKQNLNKLALEQEIENGLTPNQLYLKLKYFSPCK